MPRSDLQPPPPRREYKAFTCVKGMIGVSDLIVTKTRLFQGIFGKVSYPAHRRGAACHCVTHLEQPVPARNLSKRAENGGWLLRIPVRAKGIAAMECHQHFLIRDPLRWRDTRELRDPCRRGFVGRSFRRRDGPVRRKTLGPAQSAPSAAIVWKTH